MVYNKFGISGVQGFFFNMVYIIDYTEKGYTVPTEFRDHFDPSRSSITEPTKMNSKLKNAIQKSQPLNSL